MSWQALVAGAMRKEEEEDLSRRLEEVLLDRYRRSAYRPLNEDVEIDTECGEEMDGERREEQVSTSGRDRGQNWRSKGGEGAAAWSRQLSMETVRALRRNPSAPSFVPAGVQVRGEEERGEEVHL